MGNDKFDYEVIEGIHHSTKRPGAQDSFVRVEYRQESAFYKTPHVFLYAWQGDGSVAGLELSAPQARLLARFLLHAAESVEEI